GGPVVIVAGGGDSGCGGGGHRYAGQAAGKESDAGTGSVSLKFKQQFAGHRDMTIITTGQSK
ncbi:hypothetical protein, partial [uncultured Microbacterium sp.]|uniref:hypothetical protein n=1 Tax=uncultured Microbacterium sp. TaxID=191216 RepID=UPI00258CCBFD